MKWIANGLMKSNASSQQAFEDTKNTLLPIHEALNDQISSDMVPYMGLVRTHGLYLDLKMAVFVRKVPQQGLKLPDLLKVYVSLTSAHSRY